MKTQKIKKKQQIRDIVNKEEEKRYNEQKITKPFKVYIHTKHK